MDRQHSFYSDHIKGFTVLTCSIRSPRSRREKLRVMDRHGNLAFNDVDTTLSVQRVNERGERDRERESLKVLVGVYPSPSACVSDRDWIDSHVNVR